MIAKNLTSTEFTRFHYSIKVKLYVLGGHDFQRMCTIFGLRQGINLTKALFNFHEDCAINVPSGAFKKFHCSKNRKTAQSPCDYAFKRTGTFFKQHVKMYI